MAQVSGRRAVVLLAVQQALLGEVTRALRAITVEYNEDSIRLLAFFDRQPDEEDEEAMSLVGTELIAMFPESHSISIELVTKPEPQPIPKDQAAWVYYRKEPMPES